MAAPRKIKAILEYIKFFEDGITLFRLKPESKCRYRAGQFLHLAMDDYDPSFNWPDSRVFSIANAPSRNNCLEIIVSPKGDFTSKMVKKLKLGDEVWIKLPFGGFNFNESDNADVVLIAGGTGISPFAPFLEEALNENKQFTSISLYYGVRKKEHIVIDSMLNNATKKLANFSLHLYIEQGIDNEILHNKIGILPLEKVLTDTKMLNNPKYYLSGPKTLINSFIARYPVYNIPPENIFFDKWE